MDLTLEDFSAHFDLDTLAKFSTRPPLPKKRTSAVQVYLAGKYADRDGPMGEKRDQLREMGITITHDWMTYELPGGRTLKKNGVYAEFDINGVHNADVVVLVMDDPTYSYRGSFTELGAALALGKPILMYTPAGEYACKENVFWSHPNINRYFRWDKLVKDLAYYLSSYTIVNDAMVKAMACAHDVVHEACAAANAKKLANK